MAEDVGLQPMGLGAPMNDPWQGVQWGPWSQPQLEGGPVPASLRFLPKFDMSAGDVGLYTGVAGAGIEAFGQIVQTIQAGKRAKAIANYNADVTQANAQAQAYAAENEAQQRYRQAEIAKQDILLAQEAQKYREDRLTEQHQQILGQTRAIVAASGILMTGSPLAVYERTAQQQQLDILATRYSTNLQVRQAQERVTEAEYGATLARFGAGERLRIGGQAAGLTRAQAQDDYALAGLLQATGTLSRGVAGYAVGSEKLATARKRAQAARDPSLLGD